MVKHQPGEAAMTVPQCKGCTMVEGGVATKGACLAFDDPKYQWRNGRCWGRCDSAEEMVRRLGEMVAYADKYGIQAIAQRRELREWQQVAEAMRGGDTNG